jgi:hypothetical protein
MNVLMVVGLGIGLSGIVLSRRERGTILIPPPNLDRWAYGSLIAVCFLSLLVRRTLGSGRRLRDPQKGAARFYWAHVLSAVVGALAIPMGFAYGWLIRPRLDGVGPFWVVALALGALAYPRTQDWDDVSDRMPLPHGE